VRGLKALKGMRVFAYPFLVGNLKVYAAPVPACTNKRRVESLKTHPQINISASLAPQLHKNNDN